MPFLTGNESSPPLVVWAVFLPDDDAMIAAFWGAIEVLAEPESWQEFGTQTAEQAAQVWREAIRETEHENSN